MIRLIIVAGFMLVPKNPLVSVTLCAVALRIGVGG